jgi:hypothetical protein
MTAISAPTTVRQWQRVPPINSAANDHMTVDGVRISTPVYVDLSVTQRKALLNGVREAVQAQPNVTQPESYTGIRVETASSAQSNVETYLGVSLDVLRTVIFQRGGIECGLLIRLQEVTGIEYVAHKDFAAAFKKRGAIIKDYTTNHPFEGVADA